MKHYLLLLFFALLTQFSYPSVSFDIYTKNQSKQSQNDKDRKLSDEEVKERGLDLLVNGIVETIDEIDLRKMARSAIFETSYGFRWKMINIATGKVLIVKVDKDFNLISVRDRDNNKIM